MKADRGSKFNWVPPSSLKCATNPVVFLDVEIGSAHVGRIVLELFAQAAPETVAHFSKLFTNSPGLEGHTDSSSPSKVKGDNLDSIASADGAANAGPATSDSTAGDAHGGPATSVSADGAAGGGPATSASTAGATDGGPATSASINTSADSSLSPGAPELPSYLGSTVARALKKRFIQLGPPVFLDDGGDGSKAFKALQANFNIPGDEPTVQCRVANCGHLEVGADLDALAPIYGDGGLPWWPDDVDDSEQCEAETGFGVTATRYSKQETVLLQG
eukprot:gene7962-1178_t